MGFLCSYIKIISLLFLVQLRSCRKRMFRYNNTTAWEQSEFERQKSQKKKLQTPGSAYFPPSLLPKHGVVGWAEHLSVDCDVVQRQGMAQGRRSGQGWGSHQWSMGTWQPNTTAPPPRRGSPGRQKIGHRWGYMAVWALLLTIFGHLEPLFANFFAIFGHFGYFLATFYLGKNLESGFWLGKALAWI